MPQKVAFSHGLCRREHSRLALTRLTIGGAAAEFLRLYSVVRLAAGLRGAVLPLASRGSSYLVATRRLSASAVGLGGRRSRVATARQVQRPGADHFSSLLDERGAFAAFESIVARVSVRVGLRSVPDLHVL